MSMTAELAFPAPDGGAGRERPHPLLDGAGPRAPARPSTSAASSASFTSVENPLAASRTGHRLRCTGPRGQQDGPGVAGRTTYDHQLEAFAAAVLDGGPRTHGRCADARSPTCGSSTPIYRAAGDVAARRGQHGSVTIARAPLILTVAAACTACIPNPAPQPAADQATPRELADAPAAPAASAPR